jgi:hypothetical protein
MNMVRFLRLSILALALHATSCDSGGLYTPNGPESVRIDLQYDFDNDLVVVEFDGLRVFRDRVSTNDVLSLAKMVDLSVSEGEHSVRVVVNGKAGGSASFTAGRWPVIAVTYDRQEDDVLVALLKHPPYYD